MNAPTTPDNTAQTWRDLADQLTARQVAELKYCEAHRIPPGAATPSHLLTAARMMIRSNIAQAVCADVPAPADVVGDLSDWEEFSDGQYYRCYSAWNHPDASFGVHVAALQHQDGRIDRSIGCDVGDELTASQARALAGQLLDAAHALDAL